MGGEGLDPEDSRGSEPLEGSVWERGITGYFSTTEEQNSKDVYSSFYS